MKIKLYSILFFTVFVGVVSGYGFISFSKFVVKNVKHVLYEKENSSDSNLIQEKENYYAISSVIKYQTSTGKYNIKDENLKFPPVKAESFVVADLDSGEFIFQKNALDVKTIASLTKMMTSLVSLKNLDQKAETKVSAKAFATYGNQGGLRIGENISIKDLMYALMLQSSNDASEVIAEYAGRTEFLARMNSEAGFLEMYNTFFEDPSGLSDRNVSTGQDLFYLTKYIYKNYPEILNISTTKSYRNPAHIWYNHSVFINDQKYLGGKNGYTNKAKHTLITIFQLPIGANSEPRNISIILLGGTQNERDIRDIIIHLLKNVEFLE